MAFDPVSFGVMAGTSVLAPAITSGLSSIFGLDELSEEEKRANARRQESIDRLTAAAEGRTASPAQLAALAQQQRTQQALASLAQRGTVQQRAGNLRQAMQAAPEIMAQQGAVAAQTRAEEMARAREALANAQLGVASQEAAAGQRRREQQRALIGAGVQGVGTAAALSMMSGDATKPATQDETGTTAQAQTAAGPALAQPTKQQEAQIDASRSGYMARRGQTPEPTAQGIAPVSAMPGAGLSLGPSVGDVIGGGVRALGRGAGSAIRPLSTGIRLAGAKKAVPFPGY
jgi:hypothetical protein